MIPFPLAQAQIDDGGPGYVVAAVVVSAILVILYLLIVAMRVRDSARRLQSLEERLDRAGEQAPRPATDPRDEAIGDPEQVAAAAEARR